MRTEYKIGLFVFTMIIVIFGSLHFLLEMDKDRYEKQMAKKKQVEQKVDTVCVDGVEYVSYKGSLSVKFDPDGSLTRCNN